ncbi:hypothetical protein HRbin09_01506 [bacterium HR09]|nr:hypothetical protein HRbin09_01506 [bacterium HR09]
MNLAQLVFLHFTEGQFFAARGAEHGPELLEEPKGACGVVSAFQTTQLTGDEGGNPGFIKRQGFHRFQLSQSGKLVVG